MPEYRIVTKIDPQTSAGAAKTKADLASIDRAAETSRRNVDFAARNQAKALDQLNGKLAASKAEFDAGKISADQYARVQSNLAGQLAGVAGGAKRSADNLALVTTAQRQVTTETARSNQGLARAKNLFGQTSMGARDLGVIMGQAKKPVEDFGRAAGSAGGGGGSGGGAAGGLFNLKNAATVASGFIGGAFGVAIGIAASALVDMAIKALKTEDSIDDLVKKMREDAEATALADRAKAAFSMTLEGVTIAIQENEKAIKALEEAGRTAAQEASSEARERVMEIEGIRQKTVALIAEAKAQLALANAERYRRGGGDDAKFQRMAGATVAGAITAEIALAEEGLGKIDATLARVRSNYEKARSFRDVELGKENASAEGRINRLFDQRIEQRRRELVAQKASGAEIQRQTQLLETQRKVELDLESKRNRKPARAPSDGVSRFRSREQAIGVAINELNGAGLKTSENNQAGGVKGNHPGMGNAAHGRFAVDINQGAGVVEARVPSIKAKFDALARLYQSRGYRVLWAGNVYEAGGSGPSGPIRGANKHFDHMHLEAPSTIVGKATQASTAAQQLREGATAEKVAEQQSDFVKGIVDRAAGQGVPDNRQANLKAEIDRVLADYQRRFNEVLSPEQAKAVTEAMTAADAREIAEHFKEAYVNPLADLEAALGKTGLAREIESQKSRERTALGRELTATESRQIETSVLYGDQLSRMGAILEGLNQPIEAYKQQIAALDALMAKGRISQEQYNAQVAALQGPARGLIGAMPETGQSGFDYATLGAESEEGARYAQQLADFQTYRQQLLDMGVNYDQLVADAHAAHVDRLNGIDQARQSLQLMTASTMFEGLATIAEAGLGKQNAVYKAMFIASKAFAIADAVIKIQQGIANALAVPFPANLPLIAQVVALGASIVSNIQSATMAFSDGGMVRGPGGPRDDMINARLSDGEFVVNAAAAGRNRALLETINNGGVVEKARRQSSDTVATGRSVSGDSYVLQFGDVVVQAGSATAKDGQAVGRDVRRAIEGIVIEKLASAARPGGQLTKTRPSPMSGR